MTGDIRILTRDVSAPDRWTEWTHPTSVLEANALNEVGPLLDRVEAANREGRHAIGFLAYEAGPAFDPHIRTGPPLRGFPLAWFALFEHGRTYKPHPAALPVEKLAWKPTSTRRQYRAAIHRIKEQIASGDTYQVNYTFMLESPGPVNSEAQFFAMHAVQATPYAMLISTPGFHIASLSPELFFERDGESVRCEPMKGTCPRGPHPDLDATRGRELAASAKNRAENVMIVDMVRNDLGRIAVPGSVRTDELFKVTAWPTLWQMTSTVSARTTASLRQLFTALFPCASITGAPKIRTSAIITELEREPRGIYTGAIGWSGPGDQCRFSVAIRTAMTNRVTQIARYGVGSGIVWDSNPDDEYRECRLKARVLAKPAADCRLLETLRWDADAGYCFLDGHLDRMKKSAAWLGFRMDRADLVSRLCDRAARFRGPFRRVRILLSRDGRIEIQDRPLEQPGHFAGPEDAPHMTAALDSTRQPVDSPWIYHKTTRRRVYQDAHRRHPNAGDALLINERGELMEFTIGNLVVRKNGRFFTPPLASGLLPGVFRAHLLRHGVIEESILRPEDAKAADGIYLINSVRGWMRVTLVD